MLSLFGLVGLAAGALAFRPFQARSEPEDDPWSDPRARADEAGADRTGEAPDGPDHDGGPEPDGTWPDETDGAWPEGAWLDGGPADGTGALDLPGDAGAARPEALRRSGRRTGGSFPTPPCPAGPRTT